MEENIKHSIVIPTYNRSELLSETLSSVCNQTIDKKDYEVIIINDGSSDNTEDVIRDFIKNHLEHNIRYLYQKNSGCAKARNNGIYHSQGQIIFFTDDDCVVPENWMEIILDAFRRYPEAVGVGGWYEPTDEVFEKNRYYQFHRILFNQMYYYGKKCEVHTNTNRSPAGNTANMAYKKCVLTEVGLFDENIYFTGCVDWELKLRITLAFGHSLVYLPFNVIHKKKMTFWEFFCKSFKNGRGRDYCLGKYPQLEGALYYKQSVSELIKGVRHWLNVPEKNRFWKIYLLRCLAGLCGRYVNNILGLKFSGKVIGSSQFKDKFFDIVPVIEGVARRDARIKLEKNKEPLLFVDWIFHTKCNYKCSYCFVPSNKNEHKHIPSVELFLSKFKKFFSGEWIFNFGSTEPFMIPNFLEIVERLVGMGYKINISTNLSFPIESILKFCEITSNRLNALNASLHLEYADVDSFLLKAIKIREIVGDKLRIASVAIPGNIKKLKKLEKIGEDLRELGIKFLIQLKREYSKTEHRMIFSEYNNEEIAIIRKFNYSFSNKENLNFMGKKCWAGSKYLILDVNGDGWRCFPALKKSQEYLGNILKGTLTLYKEPKACQYECCHCKDPIVCNMIDKNS